jgi:hypothetical protein
MLPLIPDAERREWQLIDAPRQVYRTPRGIGAGGISMDTIPLLPYRSTVPRRVRQWAYEIPNANRSYEEWLIAHHCDLAAMDDADLRREGRQVLARLDREPDGPARNWLSGRLAAIRHELRRRGM